MRVLYVLTRYHTNMLGTMRGWTEHGDDVYMICQKKGSIEGDQYVTPSYIGLSKLFLVWEWIHINIFHRNDPGARNLFVKFGFPPMRKIRKEIKRIKPDLVILREKSLYTAMVYRYCKQQGYRSLLSNQSPLYARVEEKHNGLRFKLESKLIPEIRITPCRQRGADLTEKKKDDHAVFAPFVVVPITTLSRREYYRNGNINILDVGKYEKRKNHFLIVEVIEKLLARFPDIVLRIVGEVDDDYARNYYAKLKDKIDKDDVGDHILLLMNYTPRQVNELYEESDLCVLASTAEPASVCIVEAMACAAPAVSSTDNGTADYIVPGVTGEIFADGNAEDLYNKILSIIIDRENIPKMGAEAYRRVCSNFVFENYYQAVMEAMGQLKHSKRRCV